MLLNFKIKNYKSFLEEAELDMQASSIKEHGSSLINVNGIEVLPIASLYGANGSGKSNFIEAFDTMKYLVLSKNKNEDYLPYLIQPFIFNDGVKENPTEFEIVLCDKIRKKEYRYGFAIKDGKFLEEWLFSKVFSNTKRLKEKCIFYRKGNNLESDIKNKEINEIIFVFSLTASNELLMTNLGKRNKNMYSFVYNWFDNECVFINYSKNGELFLNQDILEVLYDNKLFKRKLGELLNVIDEDIKGIVVKKDFDDRLNEKYFPYTIHYTDENKKIEIPLVVESCGTKKMFTFGLFIIETLLTGGALIVDELDAKLHPLIVRYIVRLFSDKESNVNNGQLIFTSHNLICLDSTDLRRDEIWFVEKKNQRSTMFSLYDFNDYNVRNDTSFGKNYLNGRFGAVPFINIKE